MVYLYITYWVTGMTTEPLFRSFRALRSQQHVQQPPNSTRPNMRNRTTHTMIISRTSTSTKDVAGLRDLVR